MTKAGIKNKVLEFNDWEFWIDRPFGAFTTSLFKGGQTREYMRRVGVDCNWLAIIFQNGAWYKSEQVWDIFEKELKIYLNNGGDVFNIVKICEQYAKSGEKRIKNLLKAPLEPAALLVELYDLFTQVISFIWLAHGFEHLYNKVLHVEVPKYMPGDVEKNIGDLSYPKKKNAHYYFEKALKGDMPLEEVQERFGWIKARGGFLPGFSLKELAAERRHLRSGQGENKKFVRPKIHPKLKELAAIAQELVYFRTLRSDVLHELMWIARPLLTKIAKHFDLSFDQLRDYSALDLMSGKIEKYEYGNFSGISWGDEFAMFHEPVLKNLKIKFQTMLRGSAAFGGVARGIVRIVKVAQEIDKVKPGDIIVAPTTAPSYIMGMKKAAAFVTDEGGITSHTAIVAREMKKPCIIGTKIATKVLKDGMTVEVDADKGTVKILKKA